MKREEAHKGLGSRIAKASIVVGLAHLLFKLAGVLLATVMARHVDKSVYDTVYVVAFEGCIFTIFLIGEEVIGPTFLPVFMRELDDKGEPAARQFSSIVLTLQFVILLVVVAVVMIFSRSIVALWTTWESAEESAGKLALAADSLRGMAPALMGLSLGSTTYMLLNGRKRFFLAALGDASWKFALLLAVLIGMRLMGADHRVIVIGLVLGSVAKLVTHLIGLSDDVRAFRPSLNWRHPALRSLLILMLPLICGIIFAQLRRNYNDIWILSHLEADGILQANSLGRKLFQTIGWLIPYAISIAIFPYLCELVDRDDREQFGSLLSRSGRMLLSVFVPLALVCVVLARPIASFIFYGGKFSLESVGLTATAMAAYTLVLPAYALEYLLMQAFFARRKMVSVTLVGISVSILSMTLCYTGVVWGNLRGASALAAVGLAFTLQKTLKVTILIALLRSHSPIFPFRETAGFLVRSILTAVVAATAAYGTIRAVAQWLPGEAKLSVLLQLAAGGAAAGLAFLAMIRILRIHEPAMMLRWALEQLRRRRGV